jgi:branched-subunit amino acid transport protein AzlD
MIKIILVIALVTYLLRIMPFVLLGKQSHTPEWINFLGRFLPPAVMGMLVIYSLKSVNILVISESIPLLVASLLTILLHLWKRNNLISILGGTATYMTMLQLFMLI